MEAIKQLREAIASNQERIDQTRLILEELQQHLGGTVAYPQTRQPDSSEPDSTDRRMRE